MTREQAEKIREAHYINHATRRQRWHKLIGLIAVDDVEITGDANEVLLAELEALAGRAEQAEATLKTWVEVAEGRLKWAEEQEARAEQAEAALEAARRFEREFQRQRGAVLNPEDHWRLDRYQAEFLEALSTRDKP